MLYHQRHNSPKILFSLPALLELFTVVYQAMAAVLNILKIAYEFECYIIKGTIPQNIIVPTCATIIIYIII